MNAPSIVVECRFEIETRQFRVPSAVLGLERSVTAFLPPGYDGTTPRLLVSGVLRDRDSGLSNVVVSFSNHDGDPRHRAAARRPYGPGTRLGRYTAKAAVVPGRWTVTVAAQDRAGNRAVTNFQLAVGGGSSRPSASLYLNDGQDTGQLRLEETLGRMYLAGQVRPLVVFAVPAAWRMREYGTSDGTRSLPCAVDAGNLQGERALDYERFVIEELVPRCRRDFRVSAMPADTGILGASLGGLSAFCIAWNHTDTLGIAGALSGSFWWRAESGSLERRQVSRLMQRLVREGSYRPLRAWFEAGTRDETSDRDRDGIIDAIDDTLDLLAELTRLGFARGRELAYVEVKNGMHNYGTWAAVLPEFLRWAYPAR